MASIPTSRPYVFDRALLQVAARARVAPRSRRPSCSIALPRIWRNGCTRCCAILPRSRISGRRAKRATISVQPLRIRRADRCSRTGGARRSSEVARSRGVRACPSVRQRPAGRVRADPPRVEARRAVAGGDDRRRYAHRAAAILRAAEAECEGGVSPRVAPSADLRDFGSLLQRAGFALPVTDVDRVVVRYRQRIRADARSPAHGCDQCSGRAAADPDSPRTLCGCARFTASAFLMPTAASAPPSSDLAVGLGAA